MPPTSLGRKMKRVNTDSPAQLCPKDDSSPLYLLHGVALLILLKGPLLASPWSGVSSNLVFNCKLSSVDNQLKERTSVPTHLYVTNLIDTCDIISCLSLTSLLVSLMSMALQGQLSSDWSLRSFKKLTPSTFAVSTST